MSLGSEECYKLLELLKKSQETQKSSVVNCDL